MIKRKGRRKLRAIDSQPSLLLLCCHRLPVASAASAVNEQERKRADEEYEAKQQKALMQVRERSGR